MTEPQTKRRSSAPHRRTPPTRHVRGTIPNTSAAAAGGRRDLLRRAEVASLPAAMSVDVEDYYHVWAFETVISRGDWGKWPPRVGDNTRRLLDLFAACGAHATFFMLGCVAEADRALVRAIAAAGHEVASHGWEHIPVDRQRPDEFRRDISRTRAFLEDVAGIPVVGYRAANFSIGPKTPWAYRILTETGHCYSSSVNPISHDHYGDPSAPRDGWAPLPEVPAFREIPVASYEIGGRRLPCSGGGWFRVTPYLAFRYALRRAGRNAPPVFYIHPWEIDPDQPRLAGAPARSRLRHYANLGRTKAKLQRLLQDFRWDCINRLRLGPAAGANGAETLTAGDIR